MNPAGCYRRGHDAWTSFILGPSPLSSPHRGEELSAAAGYTLACVIGVSPCPVTQEAEVDKNQASRVLKLRTQGDIMPGLGRHPVEIGSPAQVVS